MPANNENQIAGRTLVDLLAKLDAMLTRIVHLERNLDGLLSRTAHLESNHQTQHVFVRDLAKEVGIHKSQMFRNLRQRGYDMRNVRDPSAGGRLAFAITKEEAERYLTERRGEFCLVDSRRSASQPGFLA